MGANSAIEWTDATFNAWQGCTRVSDGCVNCYAEALSKRFGRVQWGPQGARIRTSPANWRQPLKWDAAAKASGRRMRVFCCSMADVFDDHDSILPQWRVDLWKLIEATPHLDWLLLTKRPENWAHMLPVIEPGARFSHVRLGATIEHDDARKRRAEYLYLVTQLGWPTFISYEPALGPVDWSFLPALRDTWLIAGGESGPRARPPHPDWFRIARDAAACADVPFFFKQWGEHSMENISSSEVPHYMPVRVGKHAAGRLLDGRQHSAFPPSPALARAA